eukprot:GHRQ01020979.1.p2 GENE.GHRQ01020979.1~~GHRQ01020979.1.p2  ORF type:complete len:102 (-),score=13.60 GHRQ01020979.1:852-1157(-)
MSCAAAVAAAPACCCPHLRSQEVRLIAWEHWIAADWAAQAACQQPLHTARRFDLRPTANTRACCLASGTNISSRAPVQIQCLSYACHAVLAPGRGAGPRSS